MPETSTASLIADLDAALADTFKTVKIKKASGTEYAGVKASMDIAKEEEIAGLAQQTWLKVIISPTGIAAAALPLKTEDALLFDGKRNAIQRAFHRTIQDVIVRIELIVAG